ncbi:MAG: hypothetical protein ACRDPD_02980 [Streptosporangiaceae bacterium]
MPAAACTTDSSACRLPMTGPQRRAMAAGAVSKDPRAASIAASFARECECRPADIIERLLATGKDIVHPHCIVESRYEPRRTFDLNAWRHHGRLHMGDLRAEGDLVRLDTVGGTILLVRAGAHRDGWCSRSSAMDAEAGSSGVIRAKSRPRAWA